MARTAVGAVDDRSAQASDEKALRQFELRWADLPQPAGRRPILLLSRTPAYEYLNRILIVELTTRVRGIPQEVTMGKREGLSRTCVANFDAIRSIERGLIGSRLGALPPSRHREVKLALGYALDWPELKSLI